MPMIDDDISFLYMDNSYAIFLNETTGVWAKRIPNNEDALLPSELVCVLLAYYKFYYELSFAIFFKFDGCDVKHSGS